jgi:hypothetical protein
MDLYNSGVRVLIDEYLLQESKKERDYGGFWSASSAGYCMRKLTYQRLGVPKVREDDARLQRVFTAGHIFHKWVQAITKASKVSVEQETELKDEKLNIIGHFDDLIKTKEGLILYDYKTANSRSFGYKKSLSHYHRMQVGTYLYMLRKDKYKDLSEGRVLILEKDTLRTKEFEVKWNKELAMDVYNYWSTLNSYWERKEIPNCTCADFEGGFLAKEQYNDYFYMGEPCSMKWYELWKENKEREESDASK